MSALDVILLVLVILVFIGVVIHYITLEKERKSVKEILEFFDKEIENNNKRKGGIKYNEI